VNFHYNLSNPLERLRAQVEALPGEFAALREQLAPPKYRAEVQRILTSLDAQVDRFKAMGLEVEDLETKLTAIRAGQE
jgi:hypothetical protein